jgi:hypothetical protein
MRALLGCGWQIEALIEIEERKQADKEFRKLLDVFPYICASTHRMEALFMRMMACLIISGSR